MARVWLPAHRLPQPPEAIIAAGTRRACDTRTFGEAWVNAFPAPLVVRHDKDGRGNGIWRAIFRRCASVSGNRGGYHRRGRQPCWRRAGRTGDQAGRSRMPYCWKCGGSWVVGHRGGGFAPTRGRYSSHTKRMGRYDNN